MRKRMEVLLNMLKSKINEIAYQNQKIALDNFAKEFDLAVFRPRYHREQNNIVHFYSKKELKSNIENIWNPTYVPKPPLWTFENTDVDGKFSYKWGNKGTINLKGLSFQEAIRDAFLDYIDEYNDSKANIYNKGE